MWCLDVFFFSKQKCYVNLTVRLWLVWNSFRFSTWKQAVRNMVCSTLARLHMNGRLWVNDPDCLIIRKDVFWAAFTYLEPKCPLVLLGKGLTNRESFGLLGLYVYIYTNRFVHPKNLRSHSLFQVPIGPNSIKKLTAQKNWHFFNKCRCPEVPLPEAQALASVVAFSGGSVIFSDDVTTLEKAGKVSTTTAVGPRCSTYEICMKPTFFHKV